MGTISGVSGSGSIEYTSSIFRRLLQIKLYVNVHLLAVLKTLTNNLHWAPCFWESSTTSVKKYPAFFCNKKETVWRSQRIVAEPKKNSDSFRQNNPCAGLKSPYGLQKVEAPTISIQSAHEFAKVVSLTQRSFCHTLLLNLMFKCVFSARLFGYSWIFQ